jgi:2-hydroxycyclohexanecarboxyl-CoA dehydrogenase
MSLAGRVAIVTGAGSGIGRACSIQLARDGAALAVWDLNGDGANETVETIEKEGGRAIACIGDAADAARIAESVARTRSELGPVTVLVNNAGITGFCRFRDIDEAAWDRMMRINLKGPFLCTQAVLGDMLDAGWGRIINISSSSAQAGAPAMAHYVASKGGVIGLTKALAMELAPLGITVNNIPPGSVVTPMLESSPVDKATASQLVPMKRLGRPEDIAAACSYLASEAANYVTGQTLSVNGGRYLV